MTKKLIGCGGPPPSALPSGRRLRRLLRDHDQRPEENSHDKAVASDRKLFIVNSQRRILHRSPAMLQCPPMAAHAVVTTVSDQPGILFGLTKCSPIGAPTSATSTSSTR